MYNGLNMDYTKIIDKVFSQINGVRFDVRLWDDSVVEYGEGTEKEFTLIFKTLVAAKRILSDGALGFGEAYMDGSLQIDGNLEAYLRLRHQFKQIKPTPRLVIATLLAKSASKNRKNDISYHYDLGNDFFALFLDHKTMSYSAGLYNDDKDSLESAQQKKIEYVCDSLELPQKSSILDLGSGWGGFATYAVKKYNWNITCCTLSKKQIEYCNHLFAERSVKNDISMEYRDMINDLPHGKFDGIVMLESIEHVGQANLAGFVEQLSSRLKSGGAAYIQMTGRYQMKQVDSWTLKYVFPGGYLPSKQEIIDAAESAGLNVTDFVDDTESYILTMTEWIKRFEHNRDVIIKMFDEPFYRLWELWMHGAKVAFELNTMNLFRIKLQKPPIV
jgi:cyclopropane-fatty-acyl-phospholipid synthase